MQKESSPTIQTLGPNDAPIMKAMMTLFGEVFGDHETYCGNRPGQNYFRRLLADPHFVALVARKDDQIVGGLAAYELQKFEQERSEFYIYDLAVSEAHRRQGIATGLIRQLRTIAKERGAYVIFVQADHGDDPAIALYTKLGQREDVLHFDITPD